MDRFVKLAVLAVVLYFGVTKVVPWTKEELGVGVARDFSGGEGGGCVAVAEAEWETLAVSDLDEQIFASPAIADGRLFIRTKSRLYAFGAE
jgi:hypothetical protein